MEIRCGFDLTDGYRCFITDHRIPEDIELKFVGTHQEGLTDNDVECIRFFRCSVFKVPQGLTKIFPNLEILQISTSSLKNISKCDLVEYKNLKQLALYSNNIEYVPGDLFEGFDNLEVLNFGSNPFKIVEPNILDGLEGLKKVNLNGAINYGELKIKSSVLGEDSNTKLIKNALFDKFVQNDPQVIKDFITNLQAKVQIARKFNKNLIVENREIAEKYQNLEQENRRLADENQNLLNVNRNLVEQQENLNHEIHHLRALDVDINEIRAQLAHLQLENQQNKQKYLESVQKFSNLRLEYAPIIQKYQQTNEKLSADIKAFIQDETTKDFQIQIDNHQFPVHKFLLAARSPTLAELLKKNPEVENLNLVDISVEIFEKILKFLYTDELPGDDGTNFLHLFAAAGKLKIEELKNFAALKLLDIIDAENSLELLNLSNKYEHAELKKGAFEEIKRNYPKMVLNDEIIDDSDKVEKLVKIIKNIEEMEKSIGSLMV